MLSPLTKRLAVGVLASLSFGHLAGPVLVYLEVLPILEQLSRLELVRGNQLAVFAAGIGDLPVVEEKLIGRQRRLYVELRQAESYVDVLQVQPAYA